MSSNESSFKDSRLGVFCCGHLFRRERLARLVARDDDDWQFVCGESDHSDPNEPYHVSIGVLLEVDPTIDAVADLPNNWEAERVDETRPWIKLQSNVADQ